METVDKDFAPCKRIIVVAQWQDDSWTAHVCFNNKQDLYDSLDSVGNPIFVKKIATGGLKNMKDEGYIDTSKSFDLSSGYFDGFSLHNFIGRLVKS